MYAPAWEGNQLQREFLSLYLTCSDGFLQLHQLWKNLDLELTGSSHTELGTHPPNHQSRTAHTNARAAEPAGRFILGGWGKSREREMFCRTRQ